MSTEQSEEKRDNGYDWWGLNYEMGRMRIARSRTDLRIWLSTTDICTALGQDIGLVYRVVSDEEQRTIGNGAQRVDCISELGLGAMLMYCPHPSDAASPAGRLREWIATKLADELRLRTPQQDNTAKPPMLLRSKKAFAAMCKIPLPTLHAAIRAEVVQVETGNQINILYPLNAEYLRVKQAEYEARSRAAYEAAHSEQGRAMQALAAKVTELESEMAAQAVVKEAKARAGKAPEAPRAVGDGASANPCTALQVFRFDDKDIRITDRDGAPWWMLADICKALGIRNSADVAGRLDDDEKMTLDLSDSHSGRRGGAQSARIINESGLYSLILRSDKPEAKRFKKWITSEVLPTIRKTGGYGGTVINNRPMIDLDKLTAEHFQILKEAFGILGARERIDHLIGYPSPAAAAAAQAKRDLPPISEIPEGQRLLNLKPPRHASSFLAEDRWGKIGIYDLACKYGLPPATVEDVARKIGKRLTNIHMQDGVDIICGVFGIEPPNWYMTSGETLTRVIRGIDAAVNRAMNERADKIVTEQSLF